VDIHLFKKWLSAMLLQTIQHGENVVGIFLNKISHQHSCKRTIQKTIEDILITGSVLNTKEKNLYYSWMSHCLHTVGM
jgi:hypothetical protein